MLEENLKNIIKNERMKSMNEGKVIGIAEGIAAGKLENKRENALNMITMNALTDEQIAQGVGLPLEEVKALRQQTQH